MRLLLLALIFLLLLTLGNAWLMQRERRFATDHDYATIQLTQRSSDKYEWDAFTWREISAFVITVLVFGGIASIGPRSQKDRPPRG